MSVNTINLCDGRKPANRDGQVGAHAHFILPFYTESSGFWFASGQKISFPGVDGSQWRGRTLRGNRKANTYQKDCCSTLGTV